MSSNGNNLSAVLGGASNLSMLAAGGSPALSGLNGGGNSAPSTAGAPLAGPMEGSDAAGLGMPPPAAAAAQNNLLLLLQRQAEEQKMAQLAALTSLPADNLALLLQQQQQLQLQQQMLPADNLALLLQQQQQMLQLQALRNFPSAAAAGSRFFGGLGGGAGLGLAGFGGLGDFSGLGGFPTTNLDLLAMSKLLPSMNNPALMVPAQAATFQEASLPSILQDRKRKGRTGTFPQKLHTMLSDLERQDGGSSIASFLPHGRAFAIHKPREFVKHVMPKYFRMSRFSSFQRQLNLYDFQRITDGHDKGAYYHELFVQSRPILSTMMKRNKIKGKAVKKTTATAAAEPIQPEHMAGRKKDEDYEEEDDGSHSNGDDEDKEEEE
jgi:hypothetical protein